MEKNGQPKGVEEREINLVNILPPDVPVLFSDNMVLGISQGVVILSFMQARMPLLMKPEDWKNVEQVESVCVARIVLSNEKFGEVAAALTRVHEQMKRREEEKNAGK